MKISVDEWHVYWRGYFKTLDKFGIMDYMYWSWRYRDDKVEMYKIGK